MNKRIKDMSPALPRTPGEEALARRRSILDSILRSFEVARLNLRGSQHSPDAALIALYNGIVLSLPTQFGTNVSAQPHPKPSAEAERSMQQFETARLLANFADDEISATKGQLSSKQETKLKKFWAVGYHARYNQIVLKHRQTISSFENGEAVLRGNAFGSLTRVGNEYEALYRELQSERFSLVKGQLLGARLATLCGLISCLCTLRQIARAELLTSELERLVKTIWDKRIEFAQLVSEAKSYALNKTGLDVDSDFRLIASLEADVERLTGLEEIPI